MKHVTMRQTLSLAAVLLSANAVTLGSRLGTDAGLDAVSAEVAEIVQGVDVSGGQMLGAIFEIILDLACLSCLMTVSYAADLTSYGDLAYCAAICSAAF